MSAAVSQQPQSAHPLSCELLIESLPYNHRTLMYLLEILHTGKERDKCLQAIQNYCYLLPMLLSQDIIHEGGFARS